MRLLSELHWREARSLSRKPDDPRPAGGGRLIESAIDPPTTVGRTRSQFSLSGHAERGEKRLQLLDHIAVEADARDAVEGRRSLGGDRQGTPARRRQLGERRHRIDLE